MNSAKAASERAVGSNILRNGWCMFKVPSRYSGARCDVSTTAAMSQQYTNASTNKLAGPTLHFYAGSESKMQKCRLEGTNAL